MGLSPPELAFSQGSNKVSLERGAAPGFLVTGCRPFSDTSNVHRSAVANGLRLLENVDHRSAPA